MAGPIDYASLLATATSHIAAFANGHATVLRALDGSGEQGVTAAISNYGVRERDGMSIGRDDRRALIAATPGVQPDPELHCLIVDGEPFRIVSVRPLKPAGTILYFDCQVRR